MRPKAAGLRAELSGAADPFPPAARSRRAGDESRHAEFPAI